MKRPKILLEPDDFFALQLSALVNGGIGGGQAFRGADGNGFDSDAPHCIIGHAAWLEARTNAYAANGDPDSMFSRLKRAGFTLGMNDRAVPPDTKLTFAQYVRRLNIDIKESAA